jgi:hypothetical protein
MAATSGDAATAVKAISQMSLSFDIDSDTMTVETVEKAARMAATPVQKLAAAQALLGSSKIAVIGDDYETASRLSSLAAELARVAQSAPGPVKNQFFQIVSAFEKRIQEIATAYRNAKDSFATLRAHPDDPSANLVVGRFMMEAKGDFDKALAMLAKGSDPALKALAECSLKSTSSPQEQTSLGDRWWELANREKGLSQSNLRRCAATWYRAALPRLEGFGKTRVEQRTKTAAPRVVDFLLSPKDTEFAKCISVTERLLAILAYNDWNPKPGECEVSLGDLALIMTAARFAVAAKQPVPEEEREVLDTFAVRLDRVFAEMQQINWKQKDLSECNRIARQNICEPGKGVFVPAVARLSNSGWVRMTCDMSSESFVIPALSLHTESPEGHRWIVLGTVFSKEKWLNDGGGPLCPAILAYYAIPFPTDAELEQPDEEVQKPKSSKKAPRPKVSKRR